MILVTGAGGFVGRRLAARLGAKARAVYRGERPPIAGPQWIEVPDLKTADLRALARGAEACVHLAGLAHVRADPWRHHDENAVLTGRLARACAQEGVRRFVYVSSILATRESSYARSKLEGERLAREAGVETVVVRPPLVYGPGVKANMRALIEAARLGLPLPLAGLRNRRSLIYVENLVDALCFAVEEPRAAGRILIPADSEAPTPEELSRRIAAAAGRRARLFKVPKALLPANLTQELVAPASELGWKPRYTLDQGLAETVRPYGRGLFDLALAVALSVALSPLLALIALLIKATSPGPVLHWSERVGRDNKLFLMPKFRTMRVDTPQLPTHLFADAIRFVTPVGAVLRRFSLDELPQLWSIIKGDLAFVGPRPALFNQDDLVALRTERGIHRLTPGLTGWAQINGRDELPIKVKVEHDDYYRRHRSWLLDARIIIATALKVVRAEGVRH